MSKFSKFWILHWYKVSIFLTALILLNNFFVPSLYNCIALAFSMFATFNSAPDKKTYELVQFFEGKK